MIDVIVGGWQFAGIARYHSGFPLGVFNGSNNFATSFNTPGFATAIGPVETDLTRNGANGRPNLFSDPVAARALFVPTRPGEVGSRNILNGPSYTNFDLALHKTIRLPWEGHNVQFRVAAYNAFNQVNFGIRPPYNQTTLRLTDSAATFGRLDRTVGTRGGARELEFALRYSF